MTENIKRTGIKLTLILIVIILNFYGYNLTQKLTPHGALLSTSLDAEIPFIPVFVVPYLLYLLFPLVVFIVFWNDYKQYLIMSASLITILSIALIIYATFQTEVVRPFFNPVSVYEKLVSEVYFYDSPTNAFPSLHVAIPAITTAFVYEKQKKIGLLLIPIAIATILSTLFIKQHVIVDVLGSLILVYIVFQNKHHFQRLFED